MTSSFPSLSFLQRLMTPTCGQPHDKRVRETWPGGKRSWSERGKPGGCWVWHPTPGEIHGWEAKDHQNSKRKRIFQPPCCFLGGRGSFRWTNRDFAGNLFLNFQSWKNICLKLHYANWPETLDAEPSKNHWTCKENGLVTLKRGGVPFCWKNISRYVNLPQGDEHSKHLWNH